MTRDKNIQAYEQIYNESGETLVCTAGSGIQKKKKKRGGNHSKLDAVTRMDHVMEDGTMQLKYEIKG